MSDTQVIKKEKEDVVNLLLSDTAIIKISVQGLQNSISNFKYRTYYQERKKLKKF